jgi:hypothetical protein
MSYGINIKNDAGKIAFSSNYPCYQFSSKIVVAPGSNAIASFNVNSTKIPLVFVAPANSTDSPFVKAVVSNGGSSWTVEVSNGLNNQNVICYLFTVPENPQTAGFGINVFDQNGAVNFTTARRALKITGFHITTTFSGSAGAQHPATQSLTSGSIATSWASSSPNCGVYVGPAVQPGAPQRICRAVAAQRGSSTQVNLSRSALSFIAPAPEDEFSVLGGHYILFIDRTLYD